MLLIEEGPPDVIVPDLYKRCRIAQLDDGARFRNVFENNARVKAVDKRAALRSIEPGPVIALVVPNVFVKLAYLRQNAGLTAAHVRQTERVRVHRIRGGIDNRPVAKRSI